MEKNIVDAREIMNMEDMLEDMYERQIQLDKMVLDKAEVEYYEVFDKVKKALVIEVAEFINEGKSFKYWSVKSPNKDRLIDELADVLHFTTSLMTFLNKPIGITWESINNLLSRYELNDLENMLIGATTTILTVTVDPLELELMLNHVFNLTYAIGFKHGFNMMNMHEAYQNKNKVNIERQLNNY